MCDVDTHVRVDVMSTQVYVLMCDVDTGTRVEVDIQVRVNV